MERDTSAVWRSTRCLMSPPALCGCLKHMDDSYRKMAFFDRYPGGASYTSLALHSYVVLGREPWRLQDHDHLD